MKKYKLQYQTLSDMGMGELDNPGEKEITAIDDNDARRQTLKYFKYIGGEKSVVSLKLEEIIKGRILELPKLTNKTMSEEFEKTEELLDDFKKVATNQVNEFKKKPIKSIVKILVLLWIGKKLWGWLNRK